MFNKSLSIFQPTYWFDFEENSCIFSPRLEKWRNIVVASMQGLFVWRAFLRETISCTAKQVSLGLSWSICARRNYIERAFVNSFTLSLFEKVSISSIHFIQEKNHEKQLELNLKFVHRKYKLIPWMLFLLGPPCLAFFTGRTSGICRYPYFMVTKYS